MKYRALVISRQYGSGGARIASLIASRLGWRLLDSEIINEVARVTQVDSSKIQSLDERVAGWLHRLNRDALRSAALMNDTPCTNDDFLDADTVAAVTRRVIEQAATAGNCVIVGRGAQCLLHHSDVFRVFVYAPLAQRLQSVRLRSGKQITEKQLAHVDAERVRYIRTYFGRQRQDLDLYDLLISSKLGDEITAATILQAMGCEVKAPSPVLASLAH